MAPSTSTNRSSSPKRTRSSASSAAGAASLKQGQLAFSSLKRSESTPSSSGGKAKGKKGGKLVVAAPAPIDDTSDSSSDSEDEDVDRTKTLPGSTRSLRGRVGATKDVNAMEEVKERKTLNLNDKRWNKAYGEAKAKMGGVPAIHHKVNNVTKVDDILRVFDMTYEYGPCVGVTRLERWERADKMGLNPPPEIHEILMTKEGVENDRITQCALYGEV